MDLQDKYTKLEGRVYIRGIETLVRLPLDQHRRDQQQGLRTATFVSGYPGSPLAGLDLALQRAKTHLVSHHVVHHPAINEDLAATAVYGSQLFDLVPRPRYDGVLGVWYGKSPGIDRSGDVFKHANFIGTSRHGGAIILGGDDHLAKSSTLPCQSEFAYLDAAIPVLYPGSTQEILDFGMHSFALSRYCGAWVALKLVTTLCDGAATIEVSPDRHGVEIPAFEIDGQRYEKVDRRYLNPPNNLLLEEEVLHRRLEAARQYALANHLNTITLRNPDARLGIVSAGKSYYDLRQALFDMGLSDDDLARLGVRILKLGMTYPLEPTIVREFAEDLEEILVVEEKRSFVESQIQTLLFNNSARPRIYGKEDEAGQRLFPFNGELDSDMIGKTLLGRLERRGRLPESAHVRMRALQSQQIHLQATVPPRMPSYCSGCPHTTSTVLLDGQVAGAGVGCHTLSLLIDPPDKLVYMTQMGGEGSPWLGMEPFTDTEHIFQNIGDGTFAHSGSLSLQACAAAGTNITFKLLYNSGIAMTGGQTPEAGLGVAQITHKLRAEGVAHIVIVAEDTEPYRNRSALADGVEVHERVHLADVQVECEKTPGVSVLIYDQRCARKKRSMRKRGLLEDPNRFVVIHEEVCEGCGDCGEKSKCMSVRPLETEFGRKTFVHQSSCNKDYTCIQGDCPSFVTVQKGEEDEAPNRPVRHPGLELVEPTAQASCAEPYSVFLRGIGGTGVVTATALISTAAHLEGKHVLSLDQTGLAQMGGAVTSHVIIADEPFEGSNRISGARANLILGFDVLGLADSQSLRLGDPDRTVAVVDTAPTPTVHMVRDKNSEFPQLPMLRQRIDAVTRASENVYVDAGHMTEALFGSHMMTNIFCLGIAYQGGHLPVRAESLEAAIRINGVAVEGNLAAFRWGRAYQQDPGTVANQITPDGAKTADATQSEYEREISNPKQVRGYRQLCEQIPDDGELRRLLSIRLGELILYQDEKYARRYFDRVLEAYRFEQQVYPGRTKITESVARYLYKLMAYKDEYEVARLLMGRKFQNQIEKTYGAKSRVTFNLHPPSLRALGMKNKLAIPSWAASPLFALLRGLKFVRGTGWDLFGTARVRREERDLISWYQDLVAEILSRLGTGNYEALVGIASLPDQIRGYEEIKLASIRQVKEQARNELKKIAEAA